MKKLIAILLVLTMVLSLAACGGDSGANGTTPGGDKDPTNQGAPKDPTTPPTHQAGDDHNDPSNSDDPIDDDDPGYSDDEDETTEPTQASMDFSNVENTLGLNCLALAALFENSDLEEPMTAEMFKYITNLELGYNDWNESTGLSFEGYIPDPDGGYNGTYYSGYGTIPGILSLTGDTLNAFWKDLERIEELERIRFEFIPLENVAGLSDHPAMDWIYISASEELTSLDGMENLPNLRYFYCNSCPNLSDVSAVANLTALTNLEMYQGNISDISALAGLINLEHLSLWNNPVTDISPLANLPKLENLQINETLITELPAGGTTRLTEFSYPDGMTGLENLSQWVADGASLNLVMKENASLAGFENFTYLKSLNLTGSNITNEDLAYLKNVAIDTLFIGGTPVTDLSGLAGNTGLKELNISGTGITDLSPLAGCTALKAIYAEGTGVTDVSCLEGLESLTYLNLSGTPMTDVSSVAKIPNLKTLYLNYKEDLTDVSPLVNCPNLQYLYLARCTNIKDISALAASTSLKMINIFAIEGLDTSAFEGTEIEIRDYY